MHRVAVVEGDITRLEVDVIVNAANETLLGGGGVDGAIHAAAGEGLWEACRRIPEVDAGIRCPSGEVRVTDGYELPAAYLVHAVGPLYVDGRSGEAERLAACYRGALEAAVERSARSIAFPAISCGVFGYPVDEAARLAIATLEAFLCSDTSLERVILATFEPATTRAFQSALDAVRHRSEGP